MSNIDEFESLFRRAEREPFVYRPHEVRKVVVLVDRDESFGNDVREAVRTLLPPVANAEFTVIPGDRIGTVGDIERLVEESRPDLLVTFRLLGEKEAIPQHSLGRYLDILTQTLPPPVLVLGGTAAEPALPAKAAETVVVLTDHIRGDSRLISTAAAISPAGAKLLLCHVEDDAVLARYLDAVGQIPELNSDVARRELPEVLLGEAREYITTAEAALAEAGVPHATEPNVLTGHRLETFRELIDGNDADLVVLNTQDDGQLAMHGLAYAVAVEFTGRPLLML